MSGRTSRNKGAGGEREAIALLQPAVDEVCYELNVQRFELIRDSRQRYEKKHYDIFGCPWMALEVKRVENQSGLGSWWEQVCLATAEGQTPVLMYRPNNSPWKIRTRVPISVVKGGFYEGRGMFKPVRVRMAVDITFPDFLVWFKLKLKAELTGIGNF